MDRPVLIEGDDIEEIAEQFRGWNIEVIHIGRGAMHGSGVLVPLGWGRITGVYFGLAVVLRGTSPKGYSSLVSTSPTSPPVRVGSRRIGGGTCFMLGSQALAERPTSHATDRLLVRGCAEFRALAADHSALLSRCMDLIESLRRAGLSRLGASQVQSRLHQLLLPAAASLFLQSVVLPPESGQKAIRRRAVSRACAYIDLHLRESMTLNDICHVAGVRARTLEYGFREFYDVGPVAYVRSVRLCRVRRELMAQRSAGGSVAKAARRWRFTHMGQFSRDYRILFGESPSMTLGREPNMPLLIAP
jgi:AraC-like DNA-binding protein